MKIKWSEERHELAAALAKAQGEMQSATKENVANIKMSSGGQFSYKYSTLDDIWDVARQPLSKNGLSIIQIPANDSDGFYVETTLLHSSGQWVSGLLTLPVIAGRMSELQAMGSAITYARRYMLGAMVGVTTGDDDDGQAANQHQQQNPEPVKVKPTMTPEKLLMRLNREDAVNGFFTKVSQISQSIFTEGRDWPEAEDIDAWKILFEDAKQYAQDALIHQAEMSPDQGPMPQATAETAAMDIEAEYPEIFNGE